MKVTPATFSAIWWLATWTSPKRPIARPAKLNKALSISRLNAIGRPIRSMDHSSGQSGRKLPCPQPIPR